ncbi:hypothetical protein BB560_003716 [Smittium megazygosporum]|uniref:UPF0113 domain-containing protein n=1 Tax=Smittium megazygosporum TaxID=133381 RepID=A0A2T9ZBA3_9FUNG|nr:hypothetical protein BB560_003716 [Smittium megazygosporum]
MRPLTDEETRGDNEARAECWIEESNFAGGVLWEIQQQWMSDDTPEHHGVVVFSLDGDVPLGFGATSKSASDISKDSPNAISVYHQSDVGEYLRDEDTLF